MKDYQPNVTSVTIEPIVDKSNFRWSHEVAAVAYNTPVQF